MASLETLLVLPVILMLVAGLADFSFIFKDFLVAGNAASEALRTVTAQTGSCDLAVLSNRANDNAERVLQDGGIPASRTNISIGHTVAGQTLCDRGMVGASIAVRSHFWFVNSWFFSLMPGLGLPPVNFTARAKGQN
jgi:hypothetical protein